MKQLWYGIALLAVLLIGSLFLGNHLENACQQPIRDLDRAAEAATEENWNLAAALITRAKKDWQQHRKLAAALVNHSPLEQIDTGFAQLDTYIAAADSVQFSALCACLEQSLKLLHQSHTFHWWNLL